MLWNQKDLPQPPINTYKSSVGTLDLGKLRNALLDGVKHFKDDEFLSNEAAILSRILYRMKTKFRSSKDFKLMEKLCRSLNIYFSVNIGRHLKTILEMTPKSYGIDTYLPTRNTLDFILVRLQGTAKLMEKIYDTCLIIASELNQRLYIGHFWQQLLVLFALVSRISILVKYNTKFICDLYGKLLPNSYKLQNTGKNWLPDGYILPSDLRSWMSVKWVYEEEFVDLTFEPENEIVNFFNLVQDDEDDDEVVFCDEYILLDEEDRQILNDFNKLSPIKETLTRNRMRGFSINEDDIGEEIQDVIELNSPIDDIDTIEENVGDPSDNMSNRNSQIEDIGEEMPSALEKPMPTRRSKRNKGHSVNENPGKLKKANYNNSVPYYEKENRGIANETTSINLVDDFENLDENPIFSIPSTPIGNQELRDNSSDIIILEDTVKKRLRPSGSNRSTNKKKKTKKSLQKPATDNNMNKLQMPRHKKRKLEFEIELNDDNSVLCDIDEAASINLIDSLNLEENSIFSIPSTSSKGQAFTDNSSDLIILEDTVKKKPRLSDSNRNSNKNKKSTNNKKSKKSLTNNNLNQGQLITSPTLGSSAKRKLEFDGKIPNKKMKITEETTLIRNEISLRSTKKGKNKTINNKKKTKNKEASTKTKPANSSLNLNKTLPDPQASKKKVNNKKSKKHQTVFSKKEINIDNLETSTSSPKENKLNLVLDDELKLNTNKSGKVENNSKKNLKKKLKKLEKNKPAEQVEEKIPNTDSNSNVSIIFVDGDASFSDSNYVNTISTKTLPKKGKSTKRKKSKRFSNK